MKARHLFCVMALCLAAAYAAAQDKVPDAVLECSEACFKVSSPASATYKVHEKWQINNEGGRSAATFSVTTDSFSRLTSYGVSVTKDGKTTRVARKDFVNVATGGGFVDDSYTTYYSEDIVKPPFTMEIDYTVSYKGFTFFPAFSPIQYYNQSVREASLRLELPAGMQVAWSGNVEPVVTEGKTDVWTWSVRDVPAIKKESMMPQLRDLIPMVQSHPVAFSFGGFEGVQDSWAHVGQWLEKVMEGSDNLGAESVAKVQQMTADCPDTVSKIKKLYDYLGQTTRYVDISLGIGGYRPASAQRVAQSGYGDCKALSNYMKNMLAAVGIKSYYCVVSTNKKTYPAKLHSVGLMNHAILCVPLAENSDTLWLECTNTNVPLGYAHEDIAGHEVLLVDGADSRLARVKSYPESQRWKSTHYRAVIDGDGAIDLFVSARYNLDYSEVLPALKHLDKKSLDAFLSAGMDFVPQNIRLDRQEDNFGDYAKDGADFIPTGALHYSMKGRAFARTQPGRMLVPVSPVATTISVQRTARVNPIRTRTVNVERDTVDIVLPRGYAVQTMPSDLQVSCPWAEYNVKYELQGNMVRRCVEVISTTKGTWPATEYQSWRQFAKAVRRDMESSIVLVLEQMK